jgi:glutamate 5-kinase
MSTLVLSELHRLVVKIGSSLLVDNSNRINRDWLNYLAEDVAHLCADGHQVLIVSSGAVAIGSHVLGINLRRSRLEELQAAAAAG